MATFAPTRTTETDALAHRWSTGAVLLGTRELWGDLLRVVVKTSPAPTGRRGCGVNGGTGAFNGVIEKTRRLAHGFRNSTNYRLRILLAADGARPYRGPTAATPERTLNHAELVKSRFAVGRAGCPRRVHPQPLHVTTVQLARPSDPPRRPVSSATAGSAARFALDRAQVRDGHVLVLYRAAACDLAVPSAHFVIYRSVATNLRTRPPLAGRLQASRQPPLPERTGAGRRL